jgi:hypothetical protein
VLTRELHRGDDIGRPGAAGYQSWPSEPWLHLLNRHIAKHCGRVDFRLAAPVTLRAFQHHWASQLGGQHRRGIWVLGV